MTAQSIPYLLSQALVQALGAAPDLAGAVVKDNPTDPQQLSDGARLVFVEDKGDAPLSRPGQAEGRTFTVTVGVINRTEGDRAGADADMQAAKTAVQAATLEAGRVLVASKRILAIQAAREGQRAYRVEGIDVGGAMVVTTFDIDYRTPAVR
jgi:hypothetical protein